MKPYKPSDKLGQLLLVAKGKYKSSFESIFNYWYNLYYRTSDDPQFESYWLAGKVTICLDVFKECIENKLFYGRSWINLILELINSKGRYGQDISTPEKRQQYIIDNILSKLATMQINDVKNDVTTPLIELPPIDKELIKYIKEQDKIAKRKAKKQEKIAKEEAKRLEKTITHFNKNKDKFNEEFNNSIEQWGKMIK